MTPKGRASRSITGQLTDAQTAVLDAHALEIRGAGELFFALGAPKAVQVLVVLDALNTPMVAWMAGALMLHALDLQVA